MTPFRSSWHLYWRNWAGLIALLVIGECSSAVGDSSGQNLTPSPKLEISPAAYDFSDNPKLLDRIVATPHGYFRFINKEFSQVVCAHFKNDLALIPNVNLHGDAHLEQYAITELGRGLNDFDDSSIGPAIFDLVRFGTSIHLTCRAHAWSGAEDGIIGTFLKGYRTGLNNPDITPEPPPLIRRIQATFTRDHATAMAAAEHLMEPLEIPEEEFRAIKERYREQMCARFPDLDPSYFTGKRYGRLRIGVGSALDEKYLVRIEGPTPAPTDDVIIEAKEVRDLSGIDCIQPTKKGDPFRVLTGQARIAYQPYKYMGYVVIHPRRGDPREQTFWIREWVDNYSELTIGQSFETIEDLRSIAYDVGVQLGLGHPKEIADPHAFELRQALLVAMDEFEADILSLSRQLSQRTVAAWERFKTEATHSRATE